MPTYLFSYRAPKDSVASGDRMEEWIEFFQGIGDAVVEMGKPVVAGTRVGNCGPDTKLGGFSIVTADDLESAATLAKGAPPLNYDGGVEVGEIVDPAQLHTS